MPEEIESEISREGEDVILRINLEKIALSPSIEDSPITMAKIIEKLIEDPSITKIVLVQKRDFEYDYDQTIMLVEIARLFNNLAKQKDVFSYDAMGYGGRCRRDLDRRYMEIQNIVFRMIKSDPLGSYVELKRILRRERIKEQKSIDDNEAFCIKKYVATLSYLINLLERTRIVALAKPYLAGFKVGERDVYRKILHPMVKPDFIFTKLMSEYPANGEEIDNYTVGENTEITVFKFPDSVCNLYHMMPPEFKLSEDKYDILDLAKKIMAEHKPTREEFVNPKRMREVFYNIGRDLIEELVGYRNMKLKSKEMDELARILVRYTVGFGLVEVLLQDEKIQDISMNSPAGRIPMFIVHGDYGDCKTNIIATRSESESWASKLRMISGRPLDEANPILDTELVIPGATSRVSVIAPPLDPTGLAFSFRRHRDRPWTLPLFMNVGMINPAAAGLLSFIVDGTRSMLIAGTRSSGKSSFLTSLMVEIMRRYRVITVEDTLELPTGSLRELGFNIQPMKVASALVKGSSEISASDGIRATLRLGDSSLIVGEVRSQEAVALYEAMRVGGAANVVAGTIHGDSPYGVYDRVVNDIGVPNTSFKATDIIIVATPIKSADGLHRFRRITQITEVRKHWEKDPMLEGGFVDLMRYDSKTDQLEPTSELINGESDVLKMIAANISEFAGNWDAMWQNIELRAKIKEALVKIANQMKDVTLLEAPFVIKCNDRMHLLTEKVKAETGVMDPKRIYFEWESWLRREVKKKNMKE